MRDSQKRTFRFLFWFDGTRARLVVFLHLKPRPLQSRLLLYFQNETWIADMNKNMDLFVFPEFPKEESGQARVLHRGGQCFIDVVENDQLKWKSIHFKGNLLDGRSSNTTLTRQFNWHLYYLCKMINAYHGEIISSQFPSHGSRHGPRLERCGIALISVFFFAAGVWGTDFSRHLELKGSQICWPRDTGDG